MKSISCGVLVTFSLNFVAGYARSPIQLQRAGVLTKDTIQPVVSNATECGCATYITTMYGAMSSGPSVVLTTVSSTSYSTTTIYVTENATSASDEATSTTYTTTTVTSEATAWLTVTGNPASEPVESNIASHSSVEAIPSSVSPSAGNVPASPLAAAPPLLVQNPGDQKPDEPAAPSTQAPPRTSSAHSDTATLSQPSASLDTKPPIADDSTSAKLNPTNSNIWAISYSPFDANSKCKPSAQIQNDMRSIAAKGFSTVRIYSPECSILTTILPLTQSLSLRIILGIYVHGTDTSGLNDFATQIKDSISAVSSNGNNWNAISLVVIANESVNQGVLSLDSLLTLISTARTRLRAVGYNGPVSTAETMNIWNDHGSQLCGAVDVTAANIHAFFDPHTAASSAGDFVKSQLDDLAKLCPGKPTVNSETGWPHSGNCDQQACPGANEQQVAVDALREKVGAQSVFFAFEDEVWKDAGEFGVEKSWGCGNLFKDVKKV